MGKKMDHHNNTFHLQVGLSQYVQRPNKIILTLTWLHVHTHTHIQPHHIPLVASLLYHLKQDL